MYAIVSLLEPASSETIRALWARFEAKCGLTGIRALPLPHFSYMGSDSYFFPAAEPAIQEIALATEPFKVRTAGLGIFTGPKPIVYVAIVKNKKLMDLHHQIWKQVRPFAIVPNLYYDPDRWMPHITLVYQDLELERISCAIREMALHGTEMEINVNHVAVIFNHLGRGGVKKKYPFQEGKC